MTRKFFLIMTGICLMSSITAMAAERKVLGEYFTIPG